MKKRSRIPAQITGFALPPQAEEVTLTFKEDGIEVKYYIKDDKTLDFVENHLAKLTLDEHGRIARKVVETKEVIKPQLTEESSGKRRKNSK